jgi:hypothetical protein
MFFTKNKNNERRTLVCGNIDNTSGNALGLKNNTAGGL